MTITIIAAVALWILLAQCSLLKKRVADHEAEKQFQQHSVSVNIHDTIIDTHRVHYAIAGNDSFPTILFIHGSPGSWFSFANCMWDEAVLARFRVVSVDRPGFGYSDFGRALHTAEQGAVLARLLQNLQNGQPVILCAHSMGAPIAVQIAALRPDLVSMLVLAGAPLDVNYEKPEWWRHVLNVKPLYYLLPGVYGPSNTELLYLKADLPALQAQYGNIRCHVRFIHGTNDERVPIKAITLPMETMVNARSVRVDSVEGAGHFIPWENEEVFLRFLREIRI